MIEDLRVMEDCVLVHATRTQLQERFRGPSGGGRWLMVPATFIHRIVAGTILETWHRADDESWMLELGTPVAQPAPTP
jgi:hypothetical protein